MSGPPQCSACLPSCIRKKSTTVGGGLFPSRGDADELALVGAGVGHPGGPRLPSAITLVPSFSLPDDTNLPWATSSARQSHSLTRSGLPTTWSIRGRT